MQSTDLRDHLNQRYIQLYDASPSWCSYVLLASRMNDLMDDETAVSKRIQVMKIILEAVFPFGAAGVASGKNHVSPKIYPALETKK